MSNNPLLQLREQGQSVWYDNVRRGLLRSGALARLIDTGEITGVTSNPTIFEKAIGGSTDYDEALHALVHAGKTAGEIFETLAVEDIQAVADLLRPIYERTQRRDGYVSLEVAPHKEHDTAATLDEARRLFRLLNRPNVMIKIPGTDEGIAAFEQAIGEGININVTLLFSLDAYERVARAYIAGLERYAARGGDLSGIASVASFFVSRVDTAVDALLEARIHEGRPEAEALLGRTAIANARLAYQRFKEIFAEPRFQALAARGAQVQRPLWASTGTKNPRYSDVMYVEALIGPNTVNTMPPATLDAFRDHGRVIPNSVEQDLEGARATLQALADLGIDYHAVTAQLLREGLKAFGDSYDKLIETTARKRQELLARTAGYASANVPVDPPPADLAERIWAKDGSVWSDDPAARKQIRGALGWLTLPEQMEEQAGLLETLATEVCQAGFSEVFLLGMGGSSLCPEVLRKTFGSASGYPRLTVIDTTHPDAIADQRGVDLEHTLFLVSSKSGGTIETISLFRYFYAAVEQRRGRHAGEQFIALTDPGTSLEKLAHECGFRRVLATPPDVGGRYSALTLFGLVPAALIGRDVRALLDRAETMMQACAACVPPLDNPGLWLGLLLGQQALRGRDKLTLVVPPALASFGLWVEQLIAESTGKQGKGIVPVAGEPLGGPEVYGDDRVFVALELDGAMDVPTEARLRALEAAGQPVVRLKLHDLLDLGGEFFRWEFATATAGAVLRINPFDQPNVQESKDNTAAVLANYERAGTLPAVESASPEAVGAFVQQARPGDYVALMVYVPPSDQTDAALEAIRTGLRNRLRVATTVGYGPRFLHSTGQLHKGGPNTGVFVQLVSQPRADLPIPQAPYSFGTLIAAQALGDLRSLQAHGRRVIRHDLGADPLAGLAALRQAIEQAAVG